MKPADIIRHSLALPRWSKQVLAVLLDACICVASVQLSFYLRLGEWVRIGDGPMLPIVASLILCFPIFVSCGLYRAIFRYAEAAAIAAIVRAVAIFALPFSLIFTLVGIDGVPRTIGFIQPILLFILVALSRVMIRVLAQGNDGQGPAYRAPQVLIYGAGSAGRQLASALKASREMRLVGFVDDDPKLWRSTMNGVPIFSPDALETLVAKNDVTDILLALPSAGRSRRADILKELQPLGLHVRTLPGMLEIASGRVSVSDLKDLEIEDLLGRPTVPPDAGLMGRNIVDKVVLVTGAGGSIGSELCRQIAASGPAALLLVEMNEYNLYAIHHELVEHHPDLTITPLMASVADGRRMEEIISIWRPDTIYHAAAYKHVPLVEQNVIEGIRNNVIGTLTTARIAAAHGVRAFVLISTDKAVRPTNIMGTTKRLSELILQGLQSAGGETCFSMVRFGNVLGSSGSVVPLFRRQIAAGGPITLTHPDITRYFMTIPEAANLVLQAGAMATGGDVFVLDMGSPIRIIDLARNMVALSGLHVRDAESPDGDIAIEFVGLRPGEKLYEELLIGDNPTPSDHPRILRTHEHFLPLATLEGYIDQLGAILERGDAAAACALLREVVPEYRPNSDLVDLVFQHR